MGTVGHFLIHFLQLMICGLWFLVCLQLFGSSPDYLVIFLILEVVLERDVEEKVVELGLVLLALLRIMRWERNKWTFEGVERLSFGLRSKLMSILYSRYSDEPFECFRCIANDVFVSACCARGCFSLGAFVHGWNPPCCIFVCKILTYWKKESW